MYAVYYQWFDISLLHDTEIYLRIICYRMFRYWNIYSWENVGKIVCMLYLLVLFTMIYICDVYYTYIWCSQIFISQLYISIY